MNRHSFDIILSFFYYCFFSFCCLECPLFPPDGRGNQTMVCSDSDGDWCLPFPRIFIKTQNSCNIYIFLKWNTYFPFILVSKCFCLFFIVFCLFSPRFQPERNISEEFNVCKVIILSIKIKLSLKERIISTTEKHPIVAEMENPVWVLQAAGLS